MNKRLIILLIMIVLLQACTNSINTIEPKENNDMALTKHYIIEHSKLTEEDFNDVDFDAFVKEYELTVDSLEQYDIGALLQMYKDEMRLDEQVYDYSVIYDNAEGRLTTDDLNAIDIVIWEYHEGNSNSCMVIDRGKEIVYYSAGSNLQRIDNSMMIAEWHEEDDLFLRGALYDSKITEWQNTYNGTNDGTTGNYSWAIGIQLKNGKCVSYSGYGVIDCGTPNTMLPLLQTLKEHFAQ